MHTRAIPRAAVAGAAMLAMLILWPQASWSQHCRRSCKADEQRDARGCCIPKAEESAPDKPRRERRRGREERAPRRPDADRGSATPEVREKPSSSRRERRRARRRRQVKPESQPATETAPPATAIQSATQATEPEDTVSTPDAPAGTTAETQAPDVGQTPVPVTKSPDHTETPVVNSTEAGPPPIEPQAEAEPEQRWPASLPWALVVGGMAVGGLGIAFASDNASELGDSRQNMGWVMVAAGGVAAIAGIVMLNRQHSSPKNTPSAAQSFVVPVLSPTTAGIAAGMSF